MGYSLRRMKTWTKILLAVVVTGAAAFLAGVTHHESKTKQIMDGFERRQASRDSVIAAYEVALTDMRNERDSLIVERDKYRQEVDGTLVVIEDLTTPEVTEETIEEALRWAEEWLEE